MKQFTLCILTSLLSICGFAQSNIKVDLSQWKGKSESIPFNIVEIRDTREKPNLIGIVKTKKGESRNVYFTSENTEMIDKFVEKQFTQGNEMDVILEIKTLDIQNSKMKKKSISSFQYACEFYRKDKSTITPLYTFNAHNNIHLKKSLDAPMSNYVGRAISSSILNFKKSYLTHPEWKKKITGDINTMTLDRKVHFNNLQTGDTIALDGKYKLQESDFVASVAEGEKDDAYSYFLMTYTLDEKEVGKKIKLDIYPKTFFLRSKSWAKKNDSVPNWKAHQQLLFDLASYHSNQFKKSLEEKDLSVGFYKAEINKIYNKISIQFFDEMDKLQAETLYGSKAKKEAEWRMKVNKYLGRN